MRFFFWVFTAAAIFLAVVRWLERSSVYFPLKTLGGDPGLLGLHYENIFFKTLDRKQLNGWYIPVTDPRGTVLFCHGNGGNISHRLEKIALLNALKLSVFIFDYRGYGWSQGVPSERGIYRDSQAAYDYLAKERGLPGREILVYGESLGGAVAVQLAAGREVKALILEDTFTSVKDMARIHFPVVPSWILVSKFDSLNKIRDLKCPKLIIHSRDDEIVPYEMGEKLFEVASHPKKFLSLQGGHNTAFSDSKEIYLQGVEHFLKDIE